MSRVIVSVATGEPFCTWEDRLLASIQKFHPDEKVLSWKDSLPPGSVSQAEKACNFKVHAVVEARRQGFNPIFWLDSREQVTGSLEPLWNIVEDQGYFFQSIFPYNCGEWTRDSALEPLGITREEAFGIPQLFGAHFALDFRKQIAQDFFAEFSRLEKTDVFCGPRDPEWCSDDPRVRGHRQDQTAMSVIVHKLKMRSMTGRQMRIACGGVDVLRNEI